MRSTPSHFGRPRGPYRPKPENVFYLPRDLKQYERAIKIELLGDDYEVLDTHLSVDYGHFNLED